MELIHLRSIGLDVSKSNSNRVSKSPSKPTQQDLADTVSPEQCEQWEKLQNSLRQKLKPVDDDGWSLDAVRKVGGLDISFENGTNQGTAVLVVCEFQRDGKLQLVYEDAIDVNMDLPYVSGFLFVRELPGYQMLLQRIRKSAPQLEPDIFLVDGSGMFHPRQMGSACHFGIDQDIRTIGVAKKLMVIHGDLEQEAGQQIETAELPNLGDYVEIVGTKTKRVFGMALRTSAASDNKKKQSEVSKRRVFVSVGHRISLLSARDVILRCSDVAGGSYIPEPIRIADLTGRAIERAWQQLHNSSTPSTRQLVFDVHNLLDEKQRRTMLGILEESDAAQTLATIPLETLKRRRAVIDELFVPFSLMHPDATVAEVRVAVKMEKPWAVLLKKEELGSQASGDAMRAGGGQ